MPDVTKLMLEEYLKSNYQVLNDIEDWTLYYSTHDNHWEVRCVKDGEQLYQGEVSNMDVSVWIWASSRNK